MKKALKVRRFISVMAATILLSTAILPLAVSANNHTDLEQWYNLPTMGAFLWSNPARYKEDMSSSYQRCVTATGAYSSWVYGAYTSSPTNLSACESSLRNPNNANQGTPHYTFKSGTTYYMQNWVRENGLPYAGMMFMNTSGSANRIHILWSPDSV